MSYKVRIRVKVSLFRSKYLDKNTILMMEKMEQAGEGQEFTWDYWILFRAVLWNDAADI